MLRFVYFRVRAAKNPTPENVFFRFSVHILYLLMLHGYSCRAGARMKYNLRSKLIKTGSMYLGFYASKEIKVSA